MFNAFKTVFFIKTCVVFTLKCKDIVQNTIYPEQSRRTFIFPLEFRRNYEDLVSLEILTKMSGTKSWGFLLRNPSGPEILLDFTG